MARLNLEATDCLIAVENSKFSAMFEITKFEIRSKASEIRSRLFSIAIDLQENKTDMNNDFLQLMPRAPAAIDQPMPGSECETGHVTEMQIEPTITTQDLFFLDAQCSLRIH